MELVPIANVQPVLLRIVLLLSTQLSMCVPVHRPDLLSIGAGPGGTPTSSGGSGGPEGGFVDRWRTCGATGGQDALHTLPQERGMLTMVGLTNAMKYDAYQQVWFDVMSFPCISLFVVLCSDRMNISR